MMLKLESYEQYEDLIREFRTVYKRVYSNNYFMPADIERYNHLGRAYYEMSKGSLVFYFDEERYYRVCFHVGEGQKLDIAAADKKMLIRNVYRGGQKEKILGNIDEQLTEHGFELKGITQQVRGDVQELFANSRELERYVKAKEAKGFRFVIAEPSQYDSMEEMLYQTQIIKDYQVDFKTAEEKAMLPKGSYTYVADKEGKMCAVNICMFEGDIAYGIGTAVIDEYKMHGVAPVQAYRKLELLCEQGCKTAMGWILIDNRKSMKYHASMGYQMLDKYADEWIKDINNKGEL